MVTQPLYTNLPSTAELPCSDDTPVDNEDQNLLPNLLLFMLCRIWAERMDWYFGVDMAVYHTTGVSPKVPVVPDGFLSLQVERKKGGKSRRSYATWEENDVVPILTLEMVSHQPGGEYEEKMNLYAQLGVLYYVIYNPEFWQRDRHQPFEVYKLENSHYRLQIGEPLWLPEVELGIGRCRQTFGGIEQELLCWYDQQGQAFPTPEETIHQVQKQLQIERHRANIESQRAEVESRRAETEYQRAERLAAYLRSQGIDPDNIA